MTQCFQLWKKKHISDDYILCDDLGDEWADHITFNIKDKSLSFIHSKYKRQSNGASQMQDVVGQAIKNIGNMFSSVDKFQTKMDAASLQKYKNDGVQTNITRIRNGNINNFSRDFEAILSSPSLFRKCILSCSFISKKSLEKELTKMQQGQCKGYIIQMYWILSSFSHAMKEVNVIPIIYCSE